MAKYWKKKDNYVVEKHPFETFVFPGVNTLIIGTFPTYEDNYRYKFFYSGKDNLFWDVMQEVFQEPLKFHANDEHTINERKLFLKNKEIGITDMYQMCYRRNKYSTDENLFPIVLKDVFILLNDYPTIARILFTSRTEVFGAFGLFKTYLLQRNYALPNVFRRSDKILEGKFVFNGKDIKLWVPYSPSPRLIQDGTTTKSELIQMYKTCLR